MGLEGALGLDDVKHLVNQHIGGVGRFVPLGLGQLIEQPVVPLGELVKQVVKLVGQRVLLGLVQLGVQSVGAHGDELVNPLPLFLELKLPLDHFRVVGTGVKV